jgi:hypothetical protein
LGIGWKLWANSQDKKKKERKKEKKPPSLCLQSEEVPESRKPLCRIPV